MIGKICHIKASKPGGPRFDPAQTPVERHGFGSLILLCANHQTVIDDDPVAYTVERLLKMKEDHEDHATTITDSDAIDAFQNLIDQSVHSNGQSGGIAAHTVNAGAVNFHAPARSTVAEGRTTKAIEAIWNIIVLPKKEFNDLVFVDMILTREELLACFAGHDTNAFFEMLRPYEAFDTVARKFEAAGSAGAEHERPFVSQRLYGLFFAIQAVLGRTATLVHFSFEKEHFRSWRDDDGVQQHLRAVLPAEAIATLKASAGYSLTTVVGTLEAVFLEEAERRSTGGDRRHRPGGLNRRAWSTGPACVRPCPRRLPGCLASDRGTIPGVRPRRRNGS